MYYFHILWISLTLFRLIMVCLERTPTSFGREVLRSIRSPQVVILFILLFMKETGLNGFAFFHPSIVNELGFSQSDTTTYCWAIRLGVFGMQLNSSTEPGVDNSWRVTLFTSVNAFSGIRELVLIYVNYKCDHSRSTNYKFLAYGALYLVVPEIYGTTPSLLGLKIIRNLIIDELQVS